MKQFNRIIIGTFLVWLLLAGAAAVFIQHFDHKKQSREFFVEINRIQEELISKKAFAGIDCLKYKFVKQVDFLPEESAGNTEEERSEMQDNQTLEADPEISRYFNGKEILRLGIPDTPENCDYDILPFIIDSDLRGYVRYSYTVDTGSTTGLLTAAAEAVLGIIFLFALALLLYLQKEILNPFHEISALPYELSKGHLPTELKETKNRYFGKFLWGLNLLQESLKEYRNRELQLERDKKLMILSLSHDIKTPLSTIKLYSRALYENLYEDEEKKRDTARKLEEKADQIEAFVSEIVRASSNELFEFDIRRGEFYLKNLVEMIHRAYAEKLELLKTDFKIAVFEDKLLTGDMDKLTDVFDNIIQNALKYGDGKEIAISFEEEDNCQLIRITNSGQPVSSYNLHHMFESFWRGENAIGKPGNGLGLYICKKLMQKMEGDIYAEAGVSSMSFTVVLKKG